MRPEERTERRGEKKKTSGPYGLVATKAGEKMIDQTGTKEGKEAGVAGEETGEKGGFKKDRNQKKGGGDAGDPNDREGDGNGKEENFLIRQGGRKTEEQRVEEIERVHGNGGLEKGDRNHDDHADEDVEVEVKGAESFLQRLADGPEEPEKNKKEDRMGRGGRDEDEGENPPELPLQDQGGFQF